MGTVTSIPPDPDPVAIPFRLTSETDGGTYTLVLHGEADLAVSDDVLNRGLAGLADPDVKVLILDLANVTFMDSTAISTLVLLRRGALAESKELRLVAIPDRVRRILDITGLTDVFDPPRP